MKLTDNIYAYLWPGLEMEEMEVYGNNCNSYVIADSFLSNGKLGHILVDPGHITNELGVSCLENLLAGMEKDDIKSEDITLIIATHSHPDHFEAALSLRQKTKALIALSEKEEKYLLEGPGKKIYQLFGMKIPPFKSDIYLAEGEFPLQKRKLEVLYTPGHSPGSVSLYLPEDKVLISGDVLFYGNTGRVDIPGGSGEVLKKSIEKLSCLETEYLLTGHQYGAPGVIEGKENIRKNFEFVRKNVFPYLAL